MPRKSSKEAILDALERVVLRQGLAATTMDAVAVEAGVSKGGLFYHFASKKEMLLQLMERFEERFRNRRREYEAALPDTPTRKLKAVILATIDQPARCADTSASNIVALLDDTDLREKIQNMKIRLFKELTRDAEHPEKVALAILVIDGLWVSEMFTKSLFTDEFKKRIIDELLRTIDAMGPTGPVRRGARKQGGKGT